MHGAHYARRGMQKLDEEHFTISNKSTLISLLNLTDVMNAV